MADSNMVFQYNFIDFWLIHLQAPLANAFQQVLKSAPKIEYYTKICLNICRNINLYSYSKIKDLKARPFRFENLLRAYETALFFVLHRSMI